MPPTPPECKAKAPFTVTSPHGVTEQPTCTANGHEYGHSILIADIYIITWSDDEHK